MSFFSKHKLNQYSREQLCSIGLMQLGDNAGAVMKTGGAWRPPLAAGDATGVARESLTNCFSSELSYMFALRLSLIRAGVSGAAP